MIIVIILLLLLPIWTRPNIVSSSCFFLIEMADWQQCTSSLEYMKAQATVDDKSVVCCLLTSGDLLNFCNAGNNHLPLATYGKQFSYVRLRCWQVTTSFVSFWGHIGKLYRGGLLTGPLWEALQGFLYHTHPVLRTAKQPLSTHRTTSAHWP